jgi:hypothetical protein
MTDNVYLKVVLTNAPILNAMSNIYNDSYCRWVTKADIGEILLFIYLFSLANPRQSSRCPIVSTRLKTIGVRLSAG